MARAVLISIRPVWVEKVLSGEKTLEVRKTRPKLEAPFKVYIYCTAGNLSYEVSNGMMCNISGGKLVVGEFTCDNIATYNYDYCPHPEIGMDYDCGDSWWEIADEDLKSACMTEKEFRYYAFGRKEMYGWHISNLEIYDMPKELPQFRKCCGTQDCDKCQFWENTGEYAGCLTSEERRLNRAPQSWCYVEELK
mgnify:CR=1 FL=1